MEFIDDFKMYDGHNIIEVAIGSEEDLDLEYIRYLVHEVKMINIGDKFWADYKKYQKSKNAVGVFDYGSGIIVYCVNGYSTTGIGEVIDYNTGKSKRIFWKRE